MRGRTYHATGRPPRTTITLVRERVVGSLQAVAVILFTSGAGCSLTDLDGLSVGSGSGGSAAATTTGVSAGSSTSGDPSSSASLSSGAGGGGTGSTATGSGSSSSGGDGGGPGAGGAGGGGDTCDEGEICTLVDDFSDGDADGWGTFGQCDTSGDGGALVVQASDVAETGSYCGFFSEAAYDFRGGSVTVAVDEVTTNGFGLQTYLNLTNAAEDGGIGLIQQQGTLTFADRFIVDHDPVAQRFWRISERDGDIVFSVHPADPNAEWTEILVVTDHDVSLEAVQIAVGVGTYADHADPGQGVFDCFNVPLEDCPLP